MLVKGQQKELNQEEEILNELLIKWQKVKHKNNWIFTMKKYVTP